MTGLDDARIRAIYGQWNDGNRDGVLAAFAALGPKGFTVEYIGETPLDGVAAINDMWNNYAGTCTTDVVQLIVNGNEAAALVSNNITADGNVTSLPSIETYHVDDGFLRVRYYHHTPDGPHHTG